MSGQRRQTNTAVVLGLGTILFGLATIVSGGRVLFGDTAVRSAAGAIVPLVLWFNFVAGFAYVAAGAGFMARKDWAVGLSIVIATATVLVFAAFGLHVLSGGAYELRTAVAMSLRSIIWIGIAITASRLAKSWNSRIGRSGTGGIRHA